MEDPSKQVVERLRYLLKRKSNVGVSVNAIHVKGAVITKDDIFEREINRVFESKNLESVLEELKKGLDNLYRLDLFEDIEVILDTPEDALTRKDAIDVTLLVKEKSRIKAETGTYFGNQEGNVVGAISFRNLFGRAETLQANLSFGTHTKSAFNLLFSKPLNGNMDRVLEVNTFKQTQDFTSTNSHKETNQGARVAFNFLSILGRHQLSYEGVWREIHGFSNNASFKIREEAGHSIKSSIKHILTRDERDHPIMTSNGYFAKLTTEYSGVGVGIQYLKNELELQHNIPFWDRFIFSTGFAAGWLQPLGDKQPGLSDRFFVGGPLSVRGFQTSGLGPQAERLGSTDSQKDALGGNIHWIGALNLLTPIPIKPLIDSDVVKGHFFLNGGNLIHTEKGSTVQQMIEKLGSNTDVAVGAGVVIRSPTVRLELNYCLPIYGLNANIQNRRFYIGIGFNFL